MAYIDKSTQWTATAEVSFGVTPVIDAVADYVEVVNPTMDASTENIDREVLKNSLVKAQSLLGKETSSGSMEVEFSTATGTEGAKVVNGDLLYTAGIGKRIGDVASVDEFTNVSGNTVTTINVTDGGVFEVGQAIQVIMDSGDPEYTVIREIATNTLTVAPAISDTSTASATLDVAGMVSFIISRPEDAQTTLTVQEYLESGSNRVEYTYNGVVVSDASISYPVANIVKANFSLAGAGFEVEEEGVDGGTVADRDAMCTEFSPYVAKNMTFTYDGTPYDIDSLEVKVSSDVYDTEALTTAGLTNKTVTGKSEVGGTFGREYVDTSLFAKYQAGTTGEIFGTVVNGSSTAVVYAPKVSLTEASKSVDSGIYKESLSYTCLSSQCVGNEDAITIAFG